jgi:hypothetical protein
LVAGFDGGSRRRLIEAAIEDRSSASEWTDFRSPSLLLRQDAEPRLTVIDRAVVGFKHESESQRHHCQQKVRGENDSPQRKSSLKYERKEP